jgi:hypothetical protein
VDEPEPRLSDWYPDCAFDDPEDYDALMFHRECSPPRTEHGTSAARTAVPKCSSLQDDEAESPADPGVTALPVHHPSYSA